jgi:hypothetical protein
MSSIINADTSNGLKITSDTSGEVKIQSAGSDIVTVDNSGITMAAGKTIPASALTGTLPALDGSALTGVGGGFFSELVTFSTDTTITSANNGKVYYTSTDNLVLTLPALPSGTDVIAYGIVNDSNSDLIIQANNQATEKIGVWLGSTIVGSKNEGILVSVGNHWKFIGTNTTTSAIVVNRYTTSGTYTPDSTVGAFLVCLGGSTGSTHGSTFSTRSSYGGSYGEKLYSSPTGSYTFTIGAGGATTSANVTGSNSDFNSELLVNGSGYGTPGTVTGADFSATGGAGSGSTYGGGGGGGSRAGNGGAGGGQGGGGTGGNAGSGLTGGAAATAEAVGVYNLSALMTSFLFLPGSNAPNSTNGAYGAYGRQYYTDPAGVTNLWIEGGARGTPARPGNLAGTNAAMSIIEFKG